MSIEKITSKIISDAEAEAAKITEASKAECEKVIEEAKAKAAELIRDAEENGLADKEKLIARRKSVADIDGRKLVLHEKQKYIAECFDKTAEKLVSMEKKEYIGFLISIVKNTGETEGELILNEKDSSEIGTDFIAEANKAIEGGAFTLSKETRNIKGGFILKNGSIYMNGTVESLIEDAKDKLIGEVAGQLFQ